MEDNGLREITMTNLKGKEDQNPYEILQFTEKQMFFKRLFLMIFYEKFIKEFMKEQVSSIIFLN